MSTFYIFSFGPQLAKYKIRSNSLRSCHLEIQNGYKMCYNCSHQEPRRVIALGHIGKRQGTKAIEVHTMANALVAVVIF
jgi:hypothetical protein